MCSLHSFLEEFADESNENYFYIHFKICFVQLVVKRYDVFVSVAFFVLFGVNAFDYRFIIVKILLSDEFSFVVGGFLDLFDSRR